MKTQNCIKDTKNEIKNQPEKQMQVAVDKDTRYGLGVIKEQKRFKTFDDTIRFLLDYFNQSQAA